MSSQNNNQNLNPKFEYYLNRQGMRGRGGQKGDQGESVHVTVGKNTANTYTLIFTSIDGSFETPNLRGSIIDSAGSGTFLRYDKENDRIYLSDVDQATTEEYGLVKIATENQVKGIDGGDGVITAENLGEAMSYRLVKGENIKLQYNEEDDTITISSTGGGGENLVFHQPLRRASGIPNKYSNCTALEGGGINVQFYNTYTSSVGNSLTIYNIDSAPSVELQLASNSTFVYPCGNVLTHGSDRRESNFFLGYYSGTDFVPVLYVDLYNAKAYSVLENTMSSKLTISEVANAPSGGTNNMGTGFWGNAAVQVVDRGDSYYIIACPNNAFKNGNDPVSSSYYVTRNGIEVSKSLLKGEITTAKCYIAYGTTGNIVNGLRLGTQSKELSIPDILSMTRTEFASDVVTFDNTTTAGVVLDIDSTLKIENGKLGVAGDLADVGDTINQLNDRISDLEARVEALENNIDGGTASGGTPLIGTNLDVEVTNLYAWGSSVLVYYTKTETPTVNDDVYALCANTSHVPSLYYYLKANTTIEEVVKGSTNDDDSLKFSHDTIRYRRYRSSDRTDGVIFKNDPTEWMNKI